MVIFPKTPSEIWNYCDVAVTLNEKVIDSKPEDKRVVLISKKDNEQLSKKVDLVYNSFVSILQDANFKTKLKNVVTAKNNILNKFKLWMKKL